MIKITVPYLNEILPVNLILFNMLNFCTIWTQSFFVFLPHSKSTDNLEEISSIITYPIFFSALESARRKCKKISQWCLETRYSTMAIWTFSCQELCCWWNEKSNSKINFEEKVEAEQKGCRRELCAQTSLGNHRCREKEARRQQRAEERTSF